MIGGGTVKYSIASMLENKNLQFDKDELTRTRLSLGNDIEFKKAQ